LVQGGAPQSEQAAARIAAAKDALSGGEEGIRAFLQDAKLVIVSLIGALLH
jgi:hypothetical protein